MACNRDIFTFYLYSKATHRRHRTECLPLNITVTLSFNQGKFNHTKICREGVIDYKVSWSLLYMWLVLPSDSFGRVVISDQEHPISISQYSEFMYIWDCTGIVQGREFIDGLSTHYFQLASIASNVHQSLRRMSAVSKYVLIEIKYKIWEKIFHFASEEHKCFANILHWTSV
jgi:hypothetical protein